MRMSETREITAVLLTASTNFHVGLHSDVYRLIQVKVGLMIDVIELYI